MEARGHPHAPDAILEGGDLDCGSGLLLLIRSSLDALPKGRLLELRSTEISVDEDLPAWCRLTGNELVSATRQGSVRSFLISKGPFDPGARAGAAPAPRAAPGRDVRPVSIPSSLPPPAPAPAVRPMSVMGIGSWPRPRWLLDALHARLEGRLSEDQFEAIADDAVRLAVAAQLRAGADVITDGEQRRDNYSGFVGSRLDNCQSIPLTDLLALVDDPDDLAKQFEMLDVPASEVRHPVVFGPLGRSRPLAAHEVAFARSLTVAPVKVSLPGPYLLARTMDLECITDRAYPDRDALAADVVRVLREEIHFCLAEGAAIVQIDEPVLTEVVHGRPVTGGRSFMCGALGGKKAPDVELAFAEDLLARVCAGLPRERLALHMCRGNWTPDESAALHGDYAPLLPLLSRVPVGTLFLELCTPRAGDLAILASLPRALRIGVGVLNQKAPVLDSADVIARRIERAASVFGADRLLLTPDCGFATFADNPIVNAAAAESALGAIRAAVDLVHRVG
jgi:5-methyltetrahydropteroyltriglutamate--homocysteine methyltransferase